jgi:hypothetical protein
MEEVNMALRTFAKVYKTSYDLQAAIGQVGEAANLLAKLDADRRSSTLAETLGMSPGRLNTERRRVARRFMKTSNRMNSLLRKFNKQHGEVVERIQTIGQSTRASRSTGTGRGGARPGAGRPKGSKNKRRGPGRPRGSKNKTNQE